MMIAPEGAAGGGRRRITLLGAPSSIGIKPYEDGAPRDLDRAPGVLRGCSLAARLGAQDGGDVLAPPYRDFVRPPGGVRNERQMLDYTGQLAARIETAVGQGFALVLGGDGSVVLASLLGARRATRGAVGLVYVDAHADFATPLESRTGSAASMCLGLAVGRGDSPLARLGGGAPLVAGGDVALIGRRDEDEPWYGQAALAGEGVLDIPGDDARRRGFAALVDPVLARVARAELGGFWIHLDADVIDPDLMPAVDSPTPGGPNLDELGAFLAPLARHPKALGMELTIYDPRLDPGLVGARRLVDLLAAVLADL